MFPRRQSPIVAPFPYRAYVALSGNGMASLDVEDRRHGAILDGGLAWIEPELRPVDADEIAPFVKDVVGRELRRRIGGIAGAERVDPGMQLHPAPMRLLHRHRKRIVARVSALRPREHRRPRLKRRAIHGIGGRSHVKHDCVHVRGLRAVEDRRELDPLLRRGESRPGGPVDVADRGDPEPAKFPPYRGHDVRIAARRGTRHGCRHEGRRRAGRGQHTRDNGKMEVEAALDHPPGHRAIRAAPRGAPRTRALVPHADGTARIPLDASRWHGFRTGTTGGPPVVP
jgi:hypothetical protein